jgi:hypothetical protein
VSGRLTSYRLFDEIAPFAGEPFKIGKSLRGAKVVLVVTVLMKVREEIGKFVHVQEPGAVGGPLQAI